MKKLSHLIYLSPVRLHSAVQRPHHFVHWARNRWNCQVTWIDPYPVRYPTVQDLKGLYRSSTTQQERLIGPPWVNEPWLQRLTIPALPIDPMWAGRCLNRALRMRATAALADNLANNPTAYLVVGRPCDLALQLTQAAKSKSLYDVMDDMPQFHHGASSAWMERVHQRMVSMAGAVWCSSTHLMRSTIRLGRSDCVHVGNAGPGQQDTIVNTKHRGSPWVAGYVGTLGHWFDWNSLAHWAKQLPDIEWRIVGTPSNTTPSNLPKTIQLLGPWPHKKVLHSMRTEWDLGIIPFLNNTLTNSVDPVKYYEYRQCGLPVLSSNFGEMPYKTEDQGLWLMDKIEPEKLSTKLNEWWNLPKHESTPDNSDWQMDWITRFESGLQHTI